MNDIEKLAAAIKLAGTGTDTGPIVEDNFPLSDDIGPVTDSVERFNIGLVASRAGRFKKQLGENPTDSLYDAALDGLVNDIANDFDLSIAAAANLESAEPETSDTSFDILKGSSPMIESSSISDESSQTAAQSGPFIDIPLEKFEQAGFITPTTGRGLMTEQYRRIKRPLLRNMEKGISKDVPDNVIMVTSSVSGEGKTFTAVNLAMSLALEREKTVLLIDGDVLKNTASGVLGVDRRSRGLTDVLTGEITDPSDVIMRTNVENFTYLPSGSNKAHANELLSSHKMKELIDELADRYQDRIIVLDCPPLLQTNEANVLAEYAGQIVFVVAEEDTSQSFVIEALKNIPAEKYVGVVLNKSRKRMLGNDYGYNYEYG